VSAIALVFSLAFTVNLVGGASPAFAQGAKARAEAIEAAKDKRRAAKNRKKAEVKARTRAIRAAPAWNKRFNDTMIEVYGLRNVNRAAERRTLGEIVTARSDRGASVRSDERQCLDCHHGRGQGGPIRLNNMSRLAFCDLVDDFIRTADDKPADLERLFQAWYDADCPLNGPRRPNNG